MTEKQLTSCAQRKKKQQQQYCEFLQCFITAVVDVCTDFGAEVTARLWPHFRAGQVEKVC